ncbi:MAG: mechanosensitive ion channel family protein [Oscillospiraceae bacterium]|nr:mechanosensitive ion channel family protein [Oscillospiraceae bacterium]
MTVSADTFSGITTALAGLTLTSILPKLLLIVVCLAMVRVFTKLIMKLLSRSKLDKSLHAIIRSVVKILLLFVAIMIIAASFGINVSSLLAVLSIAGVAVSLAIQDILSNFFSGVVLLGSKPFKVGDYVTIGGQSGTIVETGLTHTKLHTLDNQVILVPNSAVTSNVITNVTAEDTRRVDFTVSASYDSDPEAVKRALREAADIELVLKDQPVFAELSKYGESVIEYTLRVWVRTDDYWDAYFQILDRIRTAYAANGVKVSYPHINVHNI